MTARKKRGPGRPPLEVSRDVTKRLRLTSAEEAAQSAAAEVAGITWSEWARKAFARALNQL